MKLSIRSYYLDEPLNREELCCTLNRIARGDSLPVEEITLEQAPVPDLSPVLDQEKPVDHKRLTQLVHSHLSKAGITKAVGRRAVWVMPRAGKTLRGVVFGRAIFEEIGVHPYVAQRWSSEGERRSIDELLVVDTHDGLVKEGG